MVTIAKLVKGDMVRGPTGDVGEVVSFTRDHVHIAWSDHPNPILVPYTDYGLRLSGITKVTPADALRKVGR